MRTNELGVLGLLAASLLAATPAAAAEPGFDVNLVQARAATFARPYVVYAGDLKAPRPVWAQGRLFAARPEPLHGLASVSQAGFPTFDPQTQAWYASADGALVRVEADGRLPVVVDDVQGLDVDVRAARGVAVSREDGERIVLHTWRAGEHRRRVLLTGEAFFHPRFSPDGTRVLVAESRAGGGHTWLVETATGEAVDLGQGYDATWHPDGKRVVFVRLEHDGSTVTASTLFVLDLASRRETTVLRTVGAQSALAPAVSPDGSVVAWATAGGGLVLVAPLEAGGGKAGVP